MIISGFITCISQQYLISQNKQFISQILNDMTTDVTNDRICSEDLAQYAHEIML